MTQLTTDFAPAELDLYIDQGDTFNKVVTLKDLNGGIIDLTGYTVSTSFRQYFNSTKDFGMTASVYGDPTAGQLLLSMSSTNTALLVNPRYVYSVKVTGVQSNIRVLSGQVLISPMA